jgi:heme-degrading monooxygenase HmoA
MHARVSTYQFQPDRIDAAISRFESAMSDPDLKPEEAVILVDRSSGKGITITYWENEEAATASREAANRLRASATESEIGRASCRERV